MSDTTLKPKVCAVCGYILDQASNGKWLHSAELSGKRDHIAVPVDWDANIVRVRCDFCLMETTFAEVSTLPARSFVAPIINYASDSGWGACPRCAKLIAADRWDHLIERVLELRNDPPDYKAMLRVTVAILYDALRENVTGPIRPYQPGDENMSPERT